MSDSTTVRQAARLEIADAGRGAVAAPGRTQLLQRSKPKLVAVVGGTRTRRNFRKYRAFVFFVIVPVVATAIYMYGFAANQYISEAKFVVRSSQKQTMSGLGSLLQSAGVSGGHDDNNTVIEFLKSRDALKEVDHEISYREMVGHDSADYLSKFPSFYNDDKFESMYDYYFNSITAVNDSSSGISTLKVRAFTPEDSQRFAVALLDASERLINRMNTRALGDAVGLASQEVKIAEQRLANAQKELTAFRISAGIVDTNSSSKSFLEVLGGLERELAASRAQYLQARSAIPGSPGNQSIRDRIAALEEQIASEKAKLVGKDGSLVGSFAEFQRLTLEAEFAARAVTVANTMLESARVDALRKQLYLERIVEPNSADLSRYPRRLFTVLTVAGTALLAYLIVWLLLVNSREHAG